MCKWLLNGTQEGVCCCLSAMYNSKAALDIVTERCQLHPGVIVIYELAD